MKKRAYKNGRRQKALLKKYTKHKFHKLVCKKNKYGEKYIFNMLDSLTHYICLVDIFFHRNRHHLHRSLFFSFCLN